MSPVDELQAKRLRLAELQTAERLLSILDSYIADAEGTSERTTVREDVPRYARIAEVLLKVRADMVNAMHEES